MQLTHKWREKAVSLFKTTCSEQVNDPDQAVDIGWAQSSSIYLTPWMCWAISVAVWAH